MKPSPAVPRLARALLCSLVLTACGSGLPADGSRGGRCRLDASMACNEGLRCEAEFCDQCGRSGDRCCMGLRCDPGLRCRGGLGVDAGAVCEACGGMNQPCCAAELCGNGLACESGRCASCGGASQICCVGGRCSGTLACAMGGAQENHCF